MHTNFLDKSNFKKPGVPGLINNIQILYSTHTSILPEITKGICDSYV